MRILKNKKNINTLETKKFDKFSSQWWNLNNPLYRINKTRLNYILKCSNGLHDKKILDVGCGGGILSESMSKIGARVTGLDMSAHSLKIAKLHAYKNHLKINYIKKTIEEHVQTHTHYYDVITCMEVLEHVPSPESIIQACAIAIKPGGSVFFSTINRTFKSWFFAILGAEYITNIIPKGTHTFKKFITPSELLTWIDNTTLEEQNIIGLLYNPITKKCTLHSNLDINYILHTQCTKNIR